MIYSRVNLLLGDYNQLANWEYIKNPDVVQLNDLYKQYCHYKNFSSVMPIFNSQYTDPGNEIIGYYNNDQLIAFSLIKIYDSDNIENIQFAWDYKNPELRLGINSLKNECAIYKERGFQYMYLGSADGYKKQIKGFEIIGKL